MNAESRSTKVFVATPKDIHAAVVSAFNERDLDTFVSLYEENAAMIIPPESRRVEGADEIRAGMERLFSLGLTLRVEILEVHEANEIAVAHSKWWLDGPATEGVDMSGLGTLVSRKQDDGSWLVVIEHTMTPN